MPASWFWISQEIYQSLRHLKKKKFISPCILFSKAHSVQSLKINNSTDFQTWNCLFADFTLKFSQIFSNQTYTDPLTFGLTLFGLVTHLVVTQKALSSCCVVPQNLMFGPSLNLPKIICQWFFKILHSCDFYDGIYIVMYALILISFRLPFFFLHLSMSTWNKRTSPKVLQHRLPLHHWRYIHIFLTLWFYHFINLFHTSIVPKPQLCHLWKAECWVL